MADGSQLGASLAVSNEELFTVREAMRGLNRIVEKLQSGELEQAVLMKGCQMVAVIRPIGTRVERRPMERAERRFPCSPQGLTAANTHILTCSSPTWLEPFGVSRSVKVD